MDCILLEQNTDFFKELAVAAFLHGLKGDFLHFHCHFSTLKGYFCLIENYNGRFCDLISITEEEIEMQHLRQMIFPNAHNEDYKVLTKLIQKMLEKFCLLSTPLQCNWDKRKYILEERKFKKKAFFVTFHSSLFLPAIP